jgi:hypothetical protein
MRRRFGFGLTKDVRDFSDGMKALGRKIAEFDHVTPLKPGEVRPPGYYDRGFFSWPKRLPLFDDDRATTEKP